jgi:hypothetical protein
MVSDILYRQIPIMKNTLHISASFDKPDLLERMVEELASRRYHHGNYNMVVNSTWRTMETSSTETFVSGMLSINEQLNEPVNSPFTTQFIFTCSKLEDDHYMLNWAMSLN